MVVWLIAAIGAGFALRRNPFAMLLLVAATAAVAEFSIASLADGCETYRHLFIFHALFGYTLVFAAALLVSARGTSRT
jgi:hypothetical protein